MNSGCKMSACIKPLAVSTLLAFVTLFVIEYAVHGIWLKPMYEQTASLWRPASEMGMFPWCIIRLLVLSFTISVLYWKCKKAKASYEVCDSEGKKECPMKHTFCFAAFFGILLGTWMASSYLWMPIPGELAVKWFIGGFIEGFVVILVISCAYCDKGKCTKGAKEEGKA